MVTTNRDVYITLPVANARVTIALIHARRRKRSAQLVGEVMQSLTKDAQYVRERRRI